MQWDDLRIFLAVVRAGQIARAGRLLGVDATTIGRRLRRFEQAMGETLFEQHRDGQRLTEAGQRLVPRAHEIERTMLQLAEGARGGDQATGGVVRVSTTEGFAAWLAAHHLRSFVARHPAIGVDMVATNGFLSPSRRETDVAVLLARPRKGPLMTRKLTDYALNLYASPLYLTGRPAIEGAGDLRRHQLIGYIPDLVYAPELDYLDEIGPKLEPRLRSSSIHAQYRMVAAGNGVAVLPCFIGDADPTLVRVLPQLRIRRSFWLVTHKDTGSVPRVRHFVDWLVETATRARDVMLGA